VLKATYSCDLHLMHLIRVLVFLAAKFNFWFVASHIPGFKNVAADALSQDALSSFFSQVPQANPHPTNIPPPLVMLVSQDITWTCESSSGILYSRFSPSSHQTYQSAERRYLVFCKNFWSHFLRQSRFCATSLPVWANRAWLIPQSKLTFQECANSKSPMGERIQVLTRCLAFSKFFEE